MKDNASAVKLISITMNKPTKIIEDGKILHSTVTYFMTAKVHGQEIQTDAEMNVVSNGNGSHGCLVQTFRKYYGICIT